MSSRKEHELTEIEDGAVYQCKNCGIIKTTKGGFDTYICNPVSEKTDGDATRVPARDVSFEEDQEA